MSRNKICLVGEHFPVVFFFLPVDVSDCVCGAKVCLLGKLFAVVFILPVGRVAEIGLPPRLTSFRIIFPERGYSAKEVSTKKKHFLVQKHYF